MGSIVRYLFAIAGAVGFVAGQTADNLGLSNGYTDFSTAEFAGRLVKNSQTLASLQSSSNTAFNFLAYDYLPRRAYNGAHHIGDVTFRYRTSGASSWTSVDSASARSPVTPLATLGSGVFAGANINPTLPAGLPLTVTREWLKIGNDIALRVNFTNTGSSSVEIGSLGLPIYINNVFSQRTADATRTGCSVADPYIGLDAGYVRVTPVGGIGNALAITPLGSSPFEAWRFLSEPQGALGYQQQVFEGTYEWQIHSLAYAQNEWKSATPWNTPTSKTIAAGQTYSVGLRFAVAESISTIEKAVIDTDTPVAVGVPGYVIPRDTTASLFLNYSSPVASIDGGGAFTASLISGSNYRLMPSSSAWGRTKVTIKYANGKTQTVHYFITKSAPETVADLGRWLTTSQYFTDTSDPFGRAPSVLTYDRDVNRFVIQDSRVWIAGLSDEAGAGAYVAATMKQSIQPEAGEVAKLDDFVQKTLWGDIQAGGSYGVRASIFYYQPGAVSFQYNTSYDWTSWTSWNRAQAYTTVRAYNYIHATAAYWAMYRVARDYPAIKTQSTWDWYLNQAYETIQYCLGGNNDCGYSEVGLMGETVTGELLKDLGREGLSAKRDALEATMRRRATNWNSQSDPFGSEMAWDSTGQEGVYYWTNYFGFKSTADKTISSITGYMPTVAHWGWNGNARRYWDFVYGGKIQRIERQIHHYGSGLNSLPLLAHFERTASLYHLRVGHGGSTAPLTNIDSSGFASAAFHSYPDTLRWDPYSGDYGPNFLGLSLGQGAYAVKAAEFGGWVGFGGEATTSGSTITLKPKDAARRKVFIAGVDGGAGLKIEASAGAIESVSFDEAGSSVTVRLIQGVGTAAAKASSAVIWLSQPSKGVNATTNYQVTGASTTRGGWQVTIPSAGVDAVVRKA